MKRLVSFDEIRSISIIGIVLCHCCYGISGMSFLGHFLGGTFNIVFLALSAFLLGLAWDKKQRRSHDILFLQRRISKLAYAYYPFLLIMFTFLALAGYHVTIKDWIMHFFFLPWFDKLPGFGHLWFITLIVLCYMGVFVLTNSPGCLLKNVKWGGVIVAVLSQIILGLVGLPNYIFIYLILYILVFLYAREILEWIFNIKLQKILIISFLMLPIIILLHYWELTNKFTSVWVGLISAILIFIILNKLFDKAKENWIIGFISLISFELYLVHHVFCFGEYSLFKIIKNPILGIMTIFLLSVILAYPLHLISNKISSKM